MFVMNTAKRVMPSKHDPAVSLADIVENLERIEGYVAGLDREAFGGDTLRRDAVERCLETHLRGRLSFIPLINGIPVGCVSRLRLHLGLFELSIGLDQSCLTLRELRFRPLKSRFGSCQCRLAVPRI